MIHDAFDLFRAGREGATKYQPEGLRASAKSLMRTQSVKCYRIDLRMTYLQIITRAEVVRAFRPAVIKTE